MTSCRFWRGALALLICLPAVGARPAAAATAQDFALALDLSPDQVISASTLGSDPRGVGIFTAPLGGFPLAGDGFVILSTGKAADACLPDSNNNEKLNAGGVGQNVSTVLAGAKTNAGTDLVQLQLTLEVPHGMKGFAFDYAFFSEEWPEFYSSPYNDTFVAQVGDAPITVSPYGTVDAPGNVAYDATGNLISVNVGFGLDPRTPNPVTGTTYDGTTGLLTTSFPLPHHTPELTLTFSIFDVGDSIIDSAVFLDHFRFLKDAPDSPVTVPAAGTGTAPGVQTSFGKVTGGGAIGTDGAGGSLNGMVAGSPGISARGHWNYTSLAGDLTFRSTEISTLTFATEGGGGPGMPETPYNTATVTGQGEVNGAPGYGFTAWLSDRGEPGSADSFRIQIADPEGRVILDEGGLLQNGDLQIHPPAPQ